MSYHVHSPEHVETKIAFGETFPPYDIELEEEFVNVWPKLKEALDQLGLKLCEQYRDKTVHGTPVTGINFVSISFNLDLGPKR